MAKSANLSNSVKTLITQIFVIPHIWILLTPEECIRFCVRAVFSEKGKDPRRKKAPAEKIPENRIT